MTEITTVDWLNAICERFGIERHVHEMGGKKYFRMSRDGYHHIQYPREDILRTPKALILEVMLKGKIIRPDELEDASAPVLKERA